MEICGYSELIGLKHFKVRATASSGNQGNYHKVLYNLFKSLTNKPSVDISIEEC